MKYVFPAIKRRYMADAKLSRMGGALHNGLGSVPQKSGFHVVVTATTGEILDTFGADIDTYNLRFDIFTKGQNADRADDVLTEFRRVFDDANLQSDKFNTAGMIRQPGGGTEVEDGRGQASVNYDLIVHWSALSPLVRGA